MVVNSKKIRRLMREHDLQPKRRRRFVATTDSDHDNPIFPDLARDRIVDGPNQLWVADITYIAIATGFVYLAAILDAWSRRVVGYAISRSIDARVAVAALKAAIRVRQPPKGCIHHSDRGSQYASELYRHLLAEHGLVGSMGRRGNPYDNVLEAPFTSVADVGARHYWFVPVRLFMKDKFRSDLRAGKVTAPVLVVHGDEDTVVPITLGERLYAKIRAPKHFVRVAGGGHSDLGARAVGAAKRFVAESRGRPRNFLI